jgi:hypothetical protein
MNFMPSTRCASACYLSLLEHSCWKLLRFLIFNWFLSLHLSNKTQQYVWKSYNLYLADYTVCLPCFCGMGIWSSLFTVGTRNQTSYQEAADGNEQISKSWDQCFCDLIRIWFCHWHGTMRHVWAGSLPWSQLFGRWKFIWVPVKLTEFCRIHLLCKIFKFSVLRFTDIVSTQNTPVANNYKLQI